MPMWVWGMVAAGLLAGVVVHWLLAMAVMITFRQWYMLPYTFLHPFYWLLHTVASYKAIWELIYIPHYWEKTAHHVSKPQSTA